MLKTLLLLKIRSFSTMLMGKTKNATKGKMLLMAGIIIYLFGFLSVSVYKIFKSMGSSFVEFNLGWLFFTLYGISAFAFMVIGSVFTAKSQLFDAKDNDLMLSLPIKPGYILISRLFVTMLVNFAFEMCFAIPVIFVWCVTLKQSLNIAGAVAFIFLTVGLLLFATFLACLLGWFIAAVTKRMRNKNIVTIVISFAFLFAYLYFMPKLNGMIMNAATNPNAVGGVFEQSPVRFFGDAIASGNVVMFIITMICLTAPFALLYALLSKVYMKMLISKYGAKKKEYKESGLKITSPTAALLKQQTGRFFASAIYVINGGLGAIFLIIAAVALFIFKRKLSPFVPVFAQLPIGAFAILASVVLTAMPGTTSASIAIEAKTLWLLRSLPISSKQLLKAKLNVSNIIQMPCALLFAISVCVNFSVGIKESVFAVIGTVLAVLMTGELGLILNLIFPNQNWTDETQAVKQGISVLIMMFAGMLLAGIPVLLYFTVDAISKCANLTLYAAVLMLVLEVILRRVLMTKGVKMLENL